jgi:hypothetical protein
VAVYVNESSSSLRLLKDYQYANMKDESTRKYCLDYWAEYGFSFPYTNDEFSQIEGKEIVVYAKFSATEEKQYLISRFIAKITTLAPTLSPTSFPTFSPTTRSPTLSPTSFPTFSPTTRSPTLSPTAFPTRSPNAPPTFAPTTSAPTQGISTPDILFSTQKNSKLLSIPYYKEAISSYSGSVNKEYKFDLPQGKTEKSEIGLSLSTSSTDMQLKSNFGSQQKSIPLWLNILNHKWFDSNFGVLQITSSALSWYSKDYVDAQGQDVTEYSTTINVNVVSWNQNSIPANIKMTVLVYANSAQIGYTISNWPFFNSQSRLYHSFQLTSSSNSANYARKGLSSAMIKLGNSDIKVSSLSTDKKPISCSYAPVSGSSAALTYEFEPFQGSISYAFTASFNPPIEASPEESKAGYYYGGAAAFVVIVASGIAFYLWKKKQNQAKVESKSVIMTSVLPKKESTSTPNILKAVIPSTTKSKSKTNILLL